MSKINLKDFIVTEKDSVLQAMKKLDLNKHKIAFVVNIQNQICGSLTDGDIRRWILGNNSLEKQVLEACNRNPVTISLNDNNETIRKIFDQKKINCIPVVNAKQEITNLLFWDEYSNQPYDHIHLQPINIPVVIMAGGFGTRLEPFTTILPKPLIPIGDKSIVEHIIDKFLLYNVKEYYLTLNHKSNMIKAYFDGLEKDYSIDYVVEEKPLGTAGSLKLFIDKLPDTFFVTNCDIIINTNYNEILDFHNKNNHSITLVSSMMHYEIPYGICEIDAGGSLTRLKEKPEYNFLISTGLYLLNKDTLDLIPDNEMFHITQLMDKIKESGGSIGVFPISEKSWHDTGQWEEYRKTVEMLK